MPYVYEAHLIYYPSI